MDSSISSVSFSSNKVSTIRDSSPSTISPAGLIVDGDESLIVDTLFDEKLTEEMLESMKKAEPLGLKNICALINSHSNGDHCNGNNCVETKEIISSQATLEEMSHEYSCDISSRVAWLEMISFVSTQLLPLQ